jgi:hypothetical protein
MLILSIKFFCGRLFNLFVCDSDRGIVLSIRPNLFGDAREVAKGAVAPGCETIHCESSWCLLDPMTPSGNPAAVLGMEFLPLTRDYGWWRQISEDTNGQ